MVAAARTVDRSRRALLRGRLRAEAPALRPPWALGEDDFLEACTGCGACVAACPERVLVAGDGGPPTFDPMRGECTFCGDCVAACREPVFRPPPAAPWTLRAVVGDDCLARRGIVCSSCRDACGESAIAFPVTARVPLPVVASDGCTGCGACVAGCPARAIALEPAAGEVPADA